MPPVRKQKSFPIIGAAFAVLLFLYFSGPSLSINLNPPKRLPPLESHNGNITTDVSTVAVTAKNHIESSRPIPLDPQDQQKLNLFLQVLKTKNDNDPRLDYELKNLSPALKAALIDEYKNLPLEKRNERGMIVLMITREAELETDFRFLENVFTEAPCKSLANCEMESKADAHAASGEDVSLNYPQLVAIYQLEKRFSKNSQLLENPKFRSEVSGLLQAAVKFPAQPVSERAREVLNNLNL